MPTAQLIPWCATEVADDWSRRVRAAIRLGYDLRASQFGNSPNRRHRTRRSDPPPVPVGACVLDIGCGIGRSTEPVLSQGTAALVVGVDLSAGMLRRAREAFAGEDTVAWVQADAERLPLAAGCADVVISHRALSHIPDQRRAFREIGRVLQPGGLLDVSLFGDQALGRPVERFLREALREVVGAAAADLIGLYNPPSISAVDAAAHDAGFEAEAVTATTTYAWDDPEALVEGLLLGTTYMRAQLAPDQAREVEALVRAKARAAASERGLKDWSYQIHYRGRKPLS